MATKMAVPLAPTAETENCLQCRLCHKYHPLRMCGAFRAMKPPQRLVVARAQGYCINCLALTHTTGECDSSSSCKRCHKAHHTLMHQDAAVKRKPTANAAHQVVARKNSAAPSRANPASRYLGSPPVIKQRNNVRLQSKKKRSHATQRKAVATPVPTPAGRPRERSEPSHALLRAYKRPPSATALPEAQSATRSGPYKRSRMRWATHPCRAGSMFKRLLKQRFKN
ncbi:unnamed protein product [Ceratitis capitata]|uniref:(Mediterranean fruit fly) hypothetical protein n=1 Tax=Ceratitis capitata TaxID=7213 RepID=A0A811UMC4_CERCA|nr:unnamed protein product [Ceratitis capitata]